MADLLVAMKDRRPAEEPTSRSESWPSPPGEGDDPLALAPWSAVAAEASRPLERGTLVDRYVVLDQIGMGGMGVVYMAYDPELDRKLAIKLILPGVGGGSGHARLLREALALGKLAHPNVVAIHDVGTIGERVWLAMEFVRGQTLRAWLERPRGWREVLEVMRSAGEGLAAAHDAGLLHRDFKPDNVMIGDDGRVRVMDFGLARAWADVLDEVEQSESQPANPALTRQITQVNAIVGTPGYIAPEQFGGAELGSAADQFSFCVTLWQALYGEPPFAGRNLLQIAANVIAQRRRPPPRSRRVPSRLLRACERGLSADPSQRWPSMSALLTELQRVGAPRRWWALGVAAGLGVVGLGLWQYAEVGFRCDGARALLEGIWDDERRAEVQSAILGTELGYAPDTWERVAPALDVYAEEWAGKHTEVCEATRVTEEQTEAAMGLRMECLREHRTALRAAVDVLTRADAEVLEHAVALVEDLPRSSRCDDLELLEQQRQRVAPPEDPQVAGEVEALREHMVELDAERKAGKYARALERIEPVVQQAEALGYAPLLAEARLSHGILLEANGRYAQAETTLEQAYSLALEHGHDVVALGSAQQLLFVVGYRLARPVEGLVWADTVLPLARYGGNEVELARGLNRLGSVLVRQGDLVQAEAHHRQALEIFERTLGADQLVVSHCWNNLGIVAARREDHAEAELHYRRALEIRERVLGALHPDVAASWSNLANALVKQGDHAQAELYQRRALRIREQALGADHPTVAMSLVNLGGVLNSQGRYEEAEGVHRRALQSLEKALGAEHLDVAGSLTSLGAALVAQGKYAEAEGHLERALRIREGALGTEHLSLASCLSNLGLSSLRQGEHEQAERHYRRALQIREKGLGADHPETASSRLGLARVALVRGQLAVAVAHAEQILTIHEGSAVRPELLAQTRFVLAEALWPDDSTRVRAHALAQQARDGFASLEDIDTTQLTEVERWLAEHPAPRGEGK